MCSFCSSHSCKSNQFILLKISTGSVTPYFWLQTPCFSYFPCFPTLLETFKLFSRKRPRKLNSAGSFCHLLTKTSPNTRECSASSLFSQENLPGNTLHNKSFFTTYSISCHFLTGQLFTSCIRLLHADIDFIFTGFYNKLSIFIIKSKCF